MSTYGEGRTYIPAKHAATCEGTRISGQNGDQERSARSKEASSQGAQASDSQQRVVPQGPQPAKSVPWKAPPVGSTSVTRFSQAERVRRRVEYQRIYDRGLKVHGKFLTMFTLVNNLQFGRLGIAATRKMGGAVVRNKAKRLIREVFRRNKLAPGFDVVVIPRRELVDASLTAIEAEFRNVLERSLRRR